MTNTSNLVGFWEDGYTTPVEYLLWDEIPNYNKFSHVSEMQNPNAFFVLLFRNEYLRNTKSYRELKEMAEKYSKECIEAEEAAKAVTNERYFENLKQKYGESLLVLSRDRSASMDREEIEIFMKYVNNAEWLQYIEQTKDEIYNMLIKK